MGKKDVKAKAKVAEPSKPSKPSKKEAKVAKTPSKAKAKPVKAAKPAKKDESTDSEDEKPVVAPKQADDSEDEKPKAAQIKLAKRAADSSDSSDSDSEDEKKASISASASKKPVAKPNTSSSDSDSEKEKSAKAPAKKAAKNAAAKKPADDSSSDSSDNEDGKPKKAAKPADDDSSSDDSSDDDKKPSISSKKPADKSAAKKDDSSDSSSSDSEDEKPSTTAKKADPKDNDSSDDDSDDDSDAEMVDATKSSAPVNGKRKAPDTSPNPTKKVKLANGDAAPSTAAADSGGEQVKSVFVGQLSWSVDNDWLASEFAECGQVVSATVQMDRNTGRSRGFGYVHFSSSDAVEKALETMQGKEIDGRPIKVDKATSQTADASREKRAKFFGDDKQSPPSSTLFVGNLSFSVDEDKVWEAFNEYGVKNVRLPTDRDTGKPKGFGYVEFEDVEGAKKAFDAMKGQELDGRAIRIDYSQPRDANAPRGGGRGGGRGGFDRGRGSDRGWGGRGGRGGGDRGGRGGRGRGAPRGNPRSGGIIADGFAPKKKITF